MQPRRVPLIWSTIAVCLGAVFPAAVFSSPTAAGAAQPATVALTVTRPAEGKAGGELAENLLSLVEVAIQVDKVVTVVERREINRAIQELLLDRSRPGDPQLQLGKLLTADFLAMLELSPPDKKSKKPWGRLRVVDPKDGTIHGVTVASLDEATLEETAIQFARYVSLVAAAPGRPIVTIAVAPFESNGRFDRLRPLELGVRDLVTTRLLELSGVLTRPVAAGRKKPKKPAADTPVGKANDKKPARQPAAPAARFQIVQRSNMEQLQREQELIRSGLTDKTQSPDKLPLRGAAYLVRGELDERQSGDQYTIIVRGEMVEAASERVVEKFEFSCAPAKLESELARRIDLFVERLSTDEKLGPALRVTGNFEVESLRGRVLADVARCYRLIPTTRERQPFRSTTRGRTIGVGPTAVAANTPFGRALLGKSIDRLESVLFIKPDDALAAYALAYCYSMHQSDIYRPERADELCRQVYAAHPDSETAALALVLLAEIAFDDGTAELAPDDQAVAAERMWFSFKNTQPPYRDLHWARLIGKLAQLQKGDKEAEKLASLLGRLAPYVEVEELNPTVRMTVAYGVQRLALDLIRKSGKEPALRAKGEAVLQSWAKGKNRELADVGRQGLAEALGTKGNFHEAGEAFEKSAGEIANPQTQLERQKRDRHLIEAASSYRRGQEPERALELLLSMQEKLTADELAIARASPNSPGMDLLGIHGVELGQCYEALGQSEKAHATYVRTLELCPVMSSRGDFTPRLDALGGVPLREDRVVDVHYCPQGNKFFYDQTSLAADGQRLYVGNKEGLSAFYRLGQQWEETDFPVKAVTCVKAGDGKLWVGTAADGLWRRDAAPAKWVRVAASQLPDAHIESLTLAGGSAYVGVGTQATGGLVRIDGDAVGHVFAETNAPAKAPTHVVVTDDSILACTDNAIHKYSLKDKSWSQLEGQRTFPRLFPGKDTIWESEYGRELIRFDGAADRNQFFKPAWFDRNSNAGYVVPAGKAGYAINFVSEHGDDVWFGGHPRVEGRSAGLYRLNLKTGALDQFTWSDGFKYAWFHNVYDGFWLEDSLWLATSKGLCVVTLRK